MKSTTVSVDIEINISEIKGLYYCSSESGIGMTKLFLEACEEALEEIYPNDEFEFEISAHGQNIFVKK